MVQRRVPLATGKADNSLAERLQRAERELAKRSRERRIKRINGLKGARDIVLSI